MWSGSASLVDLEQEKRVESRTLCAWKVVLTLGSAEVGEKWPRVE